MKGKIFPKWMYNSHPPTPHQPPIKRTNNNTKTKIKKKKIPKAMYNRITVVVSITIFILKDVSFDIAN
jgi:hypothetical protein